MGSRRVVNQADHPILARPMRARLAPSRRLALLFVLALGALLGAALLLAERARPAAHATRAARGAHRHPSRPARGARGAARRASRPRRTVRQRPRRRCVSARRAAALLRAPRARAPRCSAARSASGAAAARSIAAPARRAVGAERPAVFPALGGCASARGSRRPGAARPRARGGRAGADVSILAFVPTDGAAPAALQIAPSRAHPTALDLRGASSPIRRPRPASSYSATCGETLRARWDRALWSASRSPWRARVAWCFRRLRSTAGVRARACSREGPAAPGSLRAEPGVLYAVLAPPLSGPDEPYHLLGFAELVGDEALARDTIAWMGETHLWRIRQQPAERFRTIDVGQPIRGETASSVPTEVAMRSAILARLWRAVGTRGTRRPAHHALLCAPTRERAPVRPRGGRRGGARPGLVAEPFPAVARVSVPVRAGPAVLRDARFGDGGAVRGLRAARREHRRDRARRTARALGGTAAGAGDGPDARGRPIALAACAARRRHARSAASCWAAALRAAGFGRRLVFWVGFGLGASCLFLATVDEYRHYALTYATYVARLRARAAPRRRDLAAGAPGRQCRTGPAGGQRRWRSR